MTLEEQRQRAELNCEIAEKSLKLVKERQRYGSFWTKLFVATGAAGLTSTLDLLTRKPEDQNGNWAVIVVSFLGMIGLSIGKFKDRSRSYTDTIK